MGKVIIFFTGMAVIILFGVSSCNEKKSAIIIQEPTELLQKADIKDAPGNNVVSVLGKGVTGQIVDITYSKDFMFYKIRTEDGRIGYVVCCDGVKTVPKN
jgi:hypothetical protein